MASIIPLHPQPTTSRATSPVTRICRECAALARQMQTSAATANYEVQLARRAELEGKLLSLSHLTPETLQEGRYYTEAALLQLESMIAAWDDQPTEAEVLLLRLLEQLHRFFDDAPVPPGNGPHASFTVSLPDRIC